MTLKNYGVDNFKITKVLSPKGPVWLTRSEYKGEDTFTKCISRLDSNGKKDPAQIEVIGLEQRAFDVSKQPIICMLINS
jgi:hypothetical protein